MSGGIGGTLCTVWASILRAVSGKTYVRDAKAPESAASAFVLTACFTVIPPPPPSALPDSPAYREVSLFSDVTLVFPVCSTSTSSISCFPP